MRRGVQGKRMRLRLIALACVILSAISAQEARGQSQTFKAWKVDILVDDFEGEVKPTLTCRCLFGRWPKNRHDVYRLFRCPLRGFSVVL